MARKHAILGRELFEKDEETLPFFSLHPKTKAGTYLRIALFGFITLFMLLTLFSNFSGYVYARYWSLYYLVYIIPAALVIALILVALFKRMKRPITKIAVPGLLGLVAVTVLMSIATMLSYSCALTFYPEIKVVHDDTTFILMRSCSYPDGTVNEVLNEGTDEETTIPHIPYLVDAYRYTAASETGENCVVEGEILIPSSATYEVKEEWTGNDTVRFYIASDESGLGSGEITVTFTDETGTASSGVPGESAEVRNRFSNESGSHSISLYREDASIESETTSIYSLTTDCFKRHYTAFPCAKLNFLKYKTRVEGEIIVEPYGKLDSLNIQELEDGVVCMTPGSTSIGATGSITIYLNEVAVTEEEDTKTAE